MSIQDDLASTFYNPATYELYKRKQGRRLTLFVNPVAPVVAGVKNSDLFTGEGETIDDVLLSLGFLIKSVSLSLGDVEFGLLLGEPGLNLPSAFKDETPLRLTGFRQNHSHSLVGRIKLAEQVSVGAAASLLYGSAPSDPRRRIDEVAISYGVLLKPEKGLQVGVSFVNLPDTLQRFSSVVERLVDESVNLGISYRLLNTTLSVDVRNLGEEREVAVREFHLGVEHVILSHLALRAGWFNNDQGNQVYSWGIGLLDGNALVSRERQFAHRNFFLNYAFVYENNSFDDQKQHFLSLNLRL